MALRLILDQLYKVQDVAYSESIALGLLFGLKDDRLLFLEIPDLFSHDHVHIVHLDLVLYFLLSFDFLSEYLWKIEHASIFNLKSILQICFQEFVKTLIFLYDARNLPGAELVYDSQSVPKNRLFNVNRPFHLNLLRGQLFNLFDLTLFTAFLIIFLRRRSLTALFVLIINDFFFFVEDT